MSGQQVILGALHTIIKLALRLLLLIFIAYKTCTSATWEMFLGGLFSIVIGQTSYLKPNNDEAHR